MKSITRFTNNIRGNKCLNCGTIISEEDNFCSKCGQVNDTQRLSVKQYFSEYLSGFFNFDNRFLKTVIPLVFKPGQVSRNYISGMRMKYVNPFQLYLHITILFFLVISVFKSIDKFKPVEDQTNEILTGINPKAKTAVIDSIRNQTIDELKKNDVALDSTTLGLINVGVDRITIDKDSLELRNKKKIGQLALPLNVYIDSLMQAPGKMDLFRDQSVDNSVKDSAMTRVLDLIDLKAKVLADSDTMVTIDSWEDISEGWSEISRKNKIKKKGIQHLDSLLTAQQTGYKVPLSLVRMSDENEKDSNLSVFLRKLQYFVDYKREHPENSPIHALNELDYEKSYWNVFLYTKSSELIDAFEDPNSDYGDEIVDRILSRISVALFLLLPVFTLIVSLLYLRRKYNYTENLVFVFHVQTVFFLLLLIFIIIGRIANSQVVIPIFFITFLIYLYKAMRTFYEQGRIKTLIKYILLNSGFLVLALIGGIIISFIAFLI